MTSSVTVTNPLSTVVTLTGHGSSVVSVTTIQPRVHIAALGTQGPIGLTGADGVGSVQNIIDIVKQTINADATQGGLTIDASGNIQLTFGTLPPLP